MRMRRILTFLIIIFIAAGLNFPDAYRLPGVKLKLVFPFNAVDADVEVRSEEEFNAAIRNVISEIKESIKIRIYKYDEKAYDINTAFKKVLDENPGLGFIEGCTSTVVRTLGQQYADVQLKIQYAYPREKVAEMRQAVESKANDIVREVIKPGMGDYEKVLAVHDYVIKNSRYDRLNADNGTVPAEEHEAYGVLVNGVGVCDSYAKAVKLLLDKSGVKCVLVEGSRAENAGQGLNAADHAWNIVRIDGAYYHVDATWDDVQEEWDSSKVGYQYFNLSDEEIQKTHIWDKSKYPQCISTKYNYFRYGNLFAENRAEAFSMLYNAIAGRKEKLVFRISDYDSSTYNIEKMIMEAAEKSRLRNGIKARWTIDETFGVLDIEFEY